MKPALPSDFCQRCLNQKNEGQDLLEALDSSAPISLRLHPYKNHDFKGNNAIPWNMEGRYLQERPSYITDPIYHGGGYYPQEASSMILAHVVKSLNFSASLNALDLCAAPGGKSTLLLDELPNESFLIANEVISNRVNILAENLNRWGYSNYVITSVDPKLMGRVLGFFDLILVDAPCSGEGMFRKDPESRNHWNSKQAEFCAQRQTRILDDIVPALKQNGYIIYSTCTFNPDENIQQINKLTTDGEFESIQIDMPKEWKIDEMKVNNAIGYQCYPHKIQGEGFFFSVIKKISPTKNPNKVKQVNSIKLKTIKSSPFEKYFLSDSELSTFEYQPGSFSIIQSHILEGLNEFTNTIRPKQIGVNSFMSKGKQIVPQHPLSLSIDLSLSLPFIELNIEQALQYLRRNDFKFENLPDGWHLVKFKGLSLGWVNNIQGRMNNKLPMEWRIKNK